MRYIELYRYLYKTTRLVGVLCCYTALTQVTARSENTYGDAQISCYQPLTHYAKAEQTRKQLCQKFYALRDCMVPRISHDPSLVATFEKDFVPFVTRHPFRCDGKRKHYKTVTDANKNGVSETEGDRNFTGRDKAHGDGLGMYHNDIVTTLICIGVVVAAALVAVFLCMHVRERRMNFAVSQHRTEKETPKCDVKKTYRDNDENHSTFPYNNNYENVDINRDMPPQRPDRNKTSSLVLQNTVKYENLESKASTEKSWNIPRVPHKSFKKLSESDSEPSPSYLREKTFHVPTMENSTHPKVGHVKEQQRRFGDSPVSHNQKLGERKVPMIPKKSSPRT